MEANLVPLSLEANLTYCLNIGKSATLRRQDFQRALGTGTLK